MNDVLPGLSCLNSLALSSSDINIKSDQIRSVAQSCQTLCDPMNRSTPGLPVHHQLPEFTETQHPSSQRCHPTISSSVAPFSFCPPSFPTLESFPMSWLFPSGGQSIRASASVLPMNIQGWFPLGLTGLILLSKDSQESSPAPQIESSHSSVLSFHYGPIPTSVHDYWKNVSAF